MSVSESFLPVHPTTENLDTTKVTQEDGTVAHREGVFIGDPATTAARARVAAQILVGDYGLATHDPRLDDLMTCLGQVLSELKMINTHLNLLTEFES